MRVQSMGMRRRMLATARPLRDDNTDSTLQLQLGPYMASCGLIARLNLDLWLNQAWGEIKTRF